MDKDLIKQKIASAFENFEISIRHHTDINVKRADDGWSVAEVADHIVKSTNVHLGGTTKTNRPYDQHAEGIRDLFLNFQTKFPAAPNLQPDQKRFSVDEAVSSLDAAKESIFKMIERDDLTETCVDIELPVWGNLTKYEWLVLFENHIIRHTKQINEFRPIGAILSQ